MTLAHRYAVSACHVPGCQSGLRARHTIRTKPTRQRPAPETARVCADCWLDAAKDPRLDAVGDGPGEYAGLVRIPAEPARTKIDQRKARKAHGANIAAALEFMRRAGRPVTTNEVEDGCGISRGWNVLRDLDRKGMVTKRRGKSGTPNTWRLK